MNQLPDDVILRDMEQWLERAVIGLNLCPFAKSVYVKGQLHWVISHAQTDAALVSDLHRELVALNETDPLLRDTTVLVVPEMLQDFLIFNDFLDIADQSLEELGLVGVLQIASFHPQFQFAGTEPDDITNFTNRAPYPALHLLREASIERAVSAYPDGEDIYKRNMERLRDLGPRGWSALDVGAHAPKDAK